MCVVDVIINCVECINKYLERSDESQPNEGEEKKAMNPIDGIKIVMCKLCVCVYHTK